MGGKINILNKRILIFRAHQILNYRAKQKEIRLMILIISIFILFATGGQCDYSPRAPR
jgi:hypothetical protein